MESSDKVSDLKIDEKGKIENYSIQDQYINIDFVRKIIDYYKEHNKDGFKNIIITVDLNTYYNHLDQKTLKFNLQFGEFGTTLYKMRTTLVNGIQIHIIGSDTVKDNIYVIAF